MAYLFFDTETSGLPKKWGVDYKKDLTNYPKLVSISWIVTDEKGKVLSEYDYIIKPVGFIVEGSEIHGITHEKAMKEGLDLDLVLRIFSFELDGNILVAHNIDFDFPVVWSELLRLGIDQKKPPMLCTMKALIYYFNIPNPNGYDTPKWASLSEMYKILFGKDFENAHSSLADVRALKKCYFEVSKDKIAKDYLNENYRHYLKT